MIFGMEVQLEEIRKFDSERIESERIESRYISDNDFREYIKQKSREKYARDSKDENFMIKKRVTNNKFKLEFKDKIKIQRKVIDAKYLSNKKQIYISGPFRPKKQIMFLILK